jgi:hypothetical protein
MGRRRGSGPIKTFLSLSGNRAAVNSWDGVDEVYGFMDLDELFKSSKINGYYWVDIYETSSGQPLVRIQGSFHGAEPCVFQGHAAWYSDRYYIFPIGSHGERGVQFAPAADLRCGCGRP